MPTKSKPMTVQRHCVAKLGVHRGAIAAARVAQWALATAELGQMPTTVEYAEWWALDERTGWRHRALVHQALGDDWQAVVEDLAAEIKRRQARSPRAVQQLAIAL
jgi:hypothetical protein